MVMKMIVNVILVVLAFSWISGVSAEKKSGSKSPESIVTCAADATSYLIFGESKHGLLNMTQTNALLVLVLWKIKGAKLLILLWGTH